MELAVSTGVRLQDIVELTMSTVEKGATLSLAFPLPSARDGGSVRQGFCEHRFVTKVFAVHLRWSSQTHGDVRLILPLCLFILFGLQNDQFLSGRVPGNGI